jgi:transcriptional regulator with XRE-family HTH domain
MTDIQDRRLSLGRLIRSRRKERGWNQTQLGRAVGIDQSTVSTWELGQSTPSGDALIRLAEVLDIPVGQLADQYFGFLTDVERATVRDELLSKEKQDILLAVYGVLTKRDSVGKASILRAKPDEAEAG